MLKDRPAEPVKAAMLLASQQLREVPHMVWQNAELRHVKWITNLWELDSPPQFRHVNS